MSDGGLLVVNTGSSSIKFALFPAASAPRRGGFACAGECTGIGGGVRLHVRDAAGAMLADADLGSGVGHQAALAHVLDWLGAHFPQCAIVAAGHRVVHGGARFSAPVRIDGAVLAALCELVPLAPLHQPHNLAAIAALAKLHPGLAQIACFDTAFHHGQPAVATRFALPRRFEQRGVRRYGFHGLSYEYIAGVLPDVLGAGAAEGRVVVAHLGSGASLCALHARRSVATTMGFTALDGLPMSRRCGSLDPGVVLYLMQHEGMSAEAVADLLYHDSGLFGVSGISDDMRVLLASAQPHARDAVDLFVYRIGRELGSLAAALGGLDALVFTAGIGENAPEIRRLVCEQAAWLGITLDAAANAAGGPRISRAGSKASVWVVPTDEDLMIARHTWALVDRGASG